MRSRMKRPSNAFAMFALPLSAAAIVATLAGCHGGSGGSGGAGRPGDVAGRYIVTVNDADIAASTLATSELGQRDENARDTLTVISLPITEPNTKFAQIDVPNSALCPPTCLSVTRDGKYAFVVEYRGAAGPDAKTVADLPKGNKVTAVDLTTPLKPTIASVAETSKEPIAVSVNPAGDLVAVITQTGRQQIVMLPFKDGAFTGEPTVWPLLGLDNDEAKPTSIAWHPSGTALAVTLQDRGEVMFYNFERGPEGLSLAPWGEPVKAGKAPFSGVFTPDGRTFIVNDVQWGKDVEGYNVGAPEGQLIAIRLGDRPVGAETPEGGLAPHAAVSAVPVGISPIGVAINSEGNLLATCNLRHSYLPDNDPRLAKYGGDEMARGGSISLVSLARDGTLTNVGEYPINAMPEGVCFDAQNHYVCVTQFRSFDPDAKDGEVGFWRISKNGSTPSLQPADFYVGVGKGPHGVLIVR
jgi:DNA-binding beta-propeller fold protein YncE